MHADGKGANGSESIDRTPGRGERLTRSQRLTRSAQFRHVFSNGKRHGTPHLVITASPNNLGCPRLGLTVPARVGSAVIRNRIKRRLREVFRRNQAAIPLPCDIVISVRPEARSSTHADLEGDFIAAMKRLT